MNDSRKDAYADAVAISVDKFLNNLQTHSRMIFCSPDGREERSQPYEGEAFIRVKVDRKVLMDEISTKATDFGQPPPTESGWSTISTRFDVEVERVVLRNEHGGDGRPIGGVWAGVAAGTVLSGLTFGISLVVGGLLGALAGMKSQEKNQKSARDENNEKISGAHQRAIVEIRTRRQRVIDAVLACNS